jgi:hypothetical protein
MVIWFILWTFGLLWIFGILFGNLVYFSLFGMLYQEKSGDPGLFVIIKIDVRTTGDRPE